MNLVVILIFSFFIFSCARTQKLCPNIVLHSKDKISLTDTEKRLLCGDPKVEAYKNIPTYQANYSFTGFLQSRGYIRPTYEYEGDVLHVHTGSQSEINKIEVTADNIKEASLVQKEVRRVYKGEILNPKNLDEVEGEARSILRQRGFPCVKVESEVNTETDEVQMLLTKLYPHKFGSYEKEKIDGLEDNALDRFYPFTEDMDFDSSLLVLTEKRMTRAGVVQGTYFQETCSESGDEFSMEQKFIDGPPRTLRFGVGASTEVGPMARVRWSNSRYKSMASVLDANLQASFKVQTLKLSADNFWWKNQPRQSFLTTLEITRESQTDYEESLLQLKPHMKWTTDKVGRNWIWTLGPTFQAGTFYTAADSNTKSFSTGALEGGLSSPSHNYEFFDVHPANGNFFNLNFDFRHPTLGFTDQILKLDSSFVNLTRLANWGKGAAIGGIRFNASTTDVNDRVDLNSLPPSVKFYGGGSDDIRGFTLKSLPDNGGRGALTKLMLKLELRKTYFFYDTVEGFAFLDNGYFGENSWTVDDRLWYSPGAGVRWLSPFGLVQAFYARGYASKPHRDEGDFIYLGLGGLF